jgi:hypothetical protein
MSDKKNMTVAELEDKCTKIRCDLLNFIYNIGMGICVASCPWWRWRWRFTQNI